MTQKHTTKSTWTKRTFHSSTCRVYKDAIWVSEYFSHIPTFHEYHTWRTWLNCMVHLDDISFSTRTEGQIGSFPKICERKQNWSQKMQFYATATAISGTHDFPRRYFTNPEKLHAVHNYPFPTSKDYKDSWASSISIEDDEDNQNLSTTSRIHEERK